MISTYWLKRITFYPKKHYLTAIIGGVPTFFLLLYSQFYNRAKPYLSIEFYINSTDML